jgi:hypothetical protein
MSFLAMGPHMHMTELRPATAEDLDRAHEFAETLRAGITKYKDYKVAISDRYQIFLPEVPQDMYHFTNFAVGFQEFSGHPNPAQPSSLLYVKTGKDNFELIGAMFNAPPGTPEDQLDNFIPLSVGRWHMHTNVCLPNGVTLNDLIQGNIGSGHSFMPGMNPPKSRKARNLNRTLGFMADGRFGLTGKIDSADECEDAGGHFLKTAWGWMIHVYPFAGDDLKVAFGMSAPELASARDRKEEP